MKAKLKNGEVINISEYATLSLDKCNSYGDPVEVDIEDIKAIYNDDGSILGMPKLNPSSLLQVHNGTDWEKVRIQAAIAAMQGLCSNENFTYTNEDGIAKASLSQADALVKILKEGYTNNDDNSRF